MIRIAKVWNGLETQNRLVRTFVGILCYISFANRNTMEEGLGSISIHYSETDRRIYYSSIAKFIQDVRTEHNFTKQCGYNDLNIASFLQ